MTAFLILLVFPAIVTYAAVSDLLSMTISNRVTLGLAGSFAAMALIVQMPLEQIGWHILAGTVVLIIAFLLFARGWIGGGDAKMAAATALWFGFDQLMPYLFIGSMVGGALTLMLLFVRRHPLPEFASRHAWIMHLHDQKTGIPYGIALAAAALIVYPDTSWMLHLGA